MKCSWCPDLGARTLQDCMYDDDLHAPRPLGEMVHMLFTFDCFDLRGGGGGRFEDGDFVMRTPDVQAQGTGLIRQALARVDSPAGAHAIVCACCS
eukprot:3461032-Pleurochrysis_carterae.AAC.1